MPLGEAVVRVGGTVGRCANTAIREYRGKIGDEICFGVYGDVVEPGRVRLGDAVTLVA